jgi:hypothetical protein
MTDVVATMGFMVLPCWIIGGLVEAHMIAHDAYRSQMPLHGRTIVNDWKTIEADIAEPHRAA